MDERVAYMVTRGDNPNWFNSSVNADLSESLRQFGVEARVYDTDAVSLVRVRYKPKHLLARIIYAFPMLGIEFPGGLNIDQVKLLDMKILVRQHAETALSTRGYV